MDPLAFQFARLQPYGKPFYRGWLFSDNNSWAITFCLN